MREPEREQGDVQVPQRVLAMAMNTRDGQRLRGLIHWSCWQSRKKHVRPITVEVFPDLLAERYPYTC
jgi:hypothetical protein